MMNISLRNTLCLIMIFSTTIDALRKTPVLILNTGATCYLNTGLQCLMQSSVATWIIEKNQNHCYQDNPLARQLALFMQSYERAEPRDTKPYTAIPYVTTDALFIEVQKEIKYELHQQQETSEAIEQLLQRTSCNKKTPSVRIISLQKIAEAPAFFEKISELAAKKAKLDEYISLVLGQYPLLNNTKTVCIGLTGAEFQIPTTLFLSPQLASEEQIPDIEASRYHLIGIAMRTTVPKSAEGHYYAIAKYPTGWYRLDEVESYGDGFNIEMRPDLNNKNLMLNTKDVEQLLTRGYKDLKRGEWGANQPARSTPVFVIYEKEEDRQEPMSNLKSSLELLAALKR